MKRLCVFLAVCLMCTVLSPAAGADTAFGLASIFGDGMVLQQGRPVQVFGFGRDGETVALTLKKGNAVVESRTAAVSGGRWSAELPAQAGSFDEYRLEAACGNAVKAVDHLVFGEVWVAGGQSNMEWTLGKAAEAAEWEKTTHDGRVRFFVTLDSGHADPQADSAGYWLVSGSWDAAKRCSAIGYMFAYRLSETLGVPVGVVNTAQGATRLCTWLGRETAEAHPDFKTLVTTRIHPGADDGTWDSLGRFYNSRIAPLRGYQAAGILWYQGEADIERGNPEVLRQGIPLLVEDWSAVFGDGAARIPFLSVQLASFSYRSDYLEGSGYTGGADGSIVPMGNFLMNQGVEQAAAFGKALSVPIYDVPVKLSEIHPPDKGPVAVKLLDAALGMVYGKKELYSGPKPVSATFDGSTVEVVFDNVGDGLKLAAGETLQGFRLGGAAVQAAIRGTHTVSIPAADGSVSDVSLAFATRNQDANLVNSGGYYPLAFQMPVERVEKHPGAAALIRPADKPGPKRVGPLPYILCALGIAAEGLALVFLLRKKGRA